VHLSEEEHEYLNGIITEGKTAAYKIKHAHILLKADAEGPNRTDGQDCGNLFREQKYGIGSPAEIGRRRHGIGTEP